MVMELYERVVLRRKRPMLAEVMPFDTETQKIYKTYGLLDDSMLTDIMAETTGFNQVLKFLELLPSKKKVTLGDVMAVVREIGEAWLADEMRTELQIERREMEIEEYVFREAGIIVHKQWGKSKRFSELDKKELQYLLASRYQAAKEAWSSQMAQLEERLGAARRDIRDTRERMKALAEKVDMFLVLQQKKLNAQVHDLITPLHLLGDAGRDAGETLNRTLRETPRETLKLNGTPRDTRNVGDAGQTLRETPRETRNAGDARETPRDTRNAGQTQRETLNGTQRDMLNGTPRETLEKTQEETPRETLDETLNGTPRDAGDAGETLRETRGETLGKTPSETPRDAGNAGGGGTTLNRTPRETPRETLDETPIDYCTLLEQTSELLMDVTARVLIERETLTEERKRCLRVLDIHKPVTQLDKVLDYSLTEAAADVTKAKREAALSDKLASSLDANIRGLRLQTDKEIADRERQMLNMQTVGRQKDERICALERRTTQLQQKLEDTEDELVNWKKKCQLLEKCRRIGYTHPGWQDKLYGIDGIEYGHTDSRSSIDSKRTSTKKRCKSAHFPRIKANKTSPSTSDLGPKSAEKKSADVSYSSSLNC